MPRRRKPTPPILTTCAHCGGPIETRNPNRRFCSDWCRRAAFDRVEGRVSSDPKFRARRERKASRQAAGERLPPGRDKGGVEAVFGVGWADVPATVGKCQNLSTKSDSYKEAIPPQKGPFPVPPKSKPRPDVEHRVEIIGLFSVGGEFHGQSASAQQVANRIGGGVARSYVEALLAAMPEVKDVGDLWTMLDT